MAPSVVDAVEGARRAGHLVYLSTGRSRAEIPDTVRSIGFDGVISAGGGFAEHGDRLVHSVVMEPAAVAELVAFYAANDIEYILQSFAAAYPSRGLRPRWATLFPHAPDGLAHEDALDDIAPGAARDGLEGIAKSTFFGSDPRTFRTVRDGMGHRFEVITGTMPYLGEAGGEVSPVGVDKGIAMARLAAWLGHDLADAIAIGDSVNDLEMLRVAGVGIAMGNADAAVKDVADEVTADIADDGVWRAFRRHGLI